MDMQTLYEIIRHNHDTRETIVVGTTLRPHDARRECVTCNRIQRDLLFYVREVRNENTQD